MSLPSLDWLRHKELVLVTVSVFQPVDRETLGIHMSSKIDMQHLDDLLSELTRESKVVHEGEQFRITMPGQQSIVAGKGAASRDVQRLLHLVQLSKRGRG